jgi:tagatose kinase
MKTPNVISMGGMLVEIMREQVNEPLDRVGTFAGPFPSGDTCIYINAVARLGHTTGFIGAIGEDEFGACILRRFSQNGVDFSQGRILPGHTTGTAFVAYSDDQSRKFIFHWRFSAAGQLGPGYLEKGYFCEAKWLHLTGCNLAVTDLARDACYGAMQLLPTGAHLSFDPNIRPELLTVDEIRALCQPVIDRATVIFPSIGEAAMLTGESTDEAGCRLWVQLGKIVVLKMGAFGCRIFFKGQETHVPGFPIEEIDPTGAGDCFCAGFTVALLEGMTLKEAGRFANAVGALAVTRLGPMEGAPTRNDVDRLMNQHPTLTGSLEAFH